MLMTIDPVFDALRHEDEAEAADSAAEREAIELVERFIKAAEHGEDESLHGANVKTTVGEALSAVSCDKPELIDAFFYWAARQTDNPVCRAMVASVAAHWARMEQGAAK